MKNTTVFKKILLASAILMSAALPFQGLADPSVPTPMVSFPVSITPANVSNIVFSVSGEANATLNYTVGTITGSTPIAANGTATFSLDLSTLPDGTITSTFTVTDALATSDPATLLAIKNTAPAIIPTPQPNVSAPTTVDNSNVSSFPYSISAEGGSTLSYSITNSMVATSTPVVGTLAIPMSGTAALSVNLSTLPDGFISGTFFITDTNGTSTSAVTLATKNTTPVAPQQPNVSAPTVIDASNAVNFPYSITALAGATLHYSVTNSAVATSTPVAGTAIIPANGMLTLPLNLSALANGPISGTFSVSDANGTSPNTLTLTSKNVAGALVTPSPSVSAPTTIDATNVAAFPYSITGEAGATLNYSIANTASTTNTISGTSVVPANGMLIIAPNLSSLPNGLISGTFSITDANGTSANSLTLTSKNVIGTPVTPQPSVSAPSTIDNSNFAAFPYSITAEAGATLHYSVTNSAVATSTPVAGIALIPANGMISALSLNLSALPNGLISGTFFITDTNGTSTSAQTLTTKNTTGAPVVNRPVITLIGASTVSVSQNSSYADAGATAVASDGHTNISSSLTSTSTVNTSIVGSYAVTYNVIDTVSGLSATSTARTVNVTAPGSGGGGGGGGGGSGGSGGGSGGGGGGGGGSSPIIPSNNTASNGGGGASGSGTTTSAGTFPPRNPVQGGSTGGGAGHISGSSSGKARGQGIGGRGFQASSTSLADGSASSTASSTATSTAATASVISALGNLGWWWILILILILLGLYAGDRYYARKQ